MEVIDKLDQAALAPLAGLQLLLEVDTGGSRLLDWVAAHRDQIEALLQQNGALLLRGLQLHSSKQFGDVLTTLFDAPLLDYAYRSTPRTELRGNVYTATEYHADQTIPQHNEHAYASNWPLRIGFLCMQPSARGGATPIGDSRLVYRLIPAAMREKFERLGIMYVRNYSDLDLPWTEVFQTTERSEVERYCAEHGISCTWLADNGLRTSQVNPATAIHPVTGDLLWFNQAHLFHVSSLEPAVRDSLVSVLGEEHLPRNTYYGDGSQIEPEVLAVIRDIYERTKVCFQWQQGDLLLLDNMLYTHGRQPYAGERKVLVGMARPHGHAT